MSAEHSQSAQSLLAANKAALVKLGATLVVILVAFLTLSSTWFQTEAGYTYIYQNTLTGNISVFTEPGVHLKLPGFSRVEEYKQVMTVTFGSSTETNRYTRQSPPISVRFADTYTGKIPVTFRFKLTADRDKMIEMHKEFRSFANLVDALLIKNSRNVTVITATQYTGEEFFQGGLNKFKSQLEDQLRNGVYLTERKQVEVEQTDLAPVGIKAQDPDELRRTKQLVWKTVPILDPETNKPKRQTNALDQYGIRVTQVTVGDPIPEAQLDRLLTDKKLLVAERIKTIQEQETARAQAKTEQLKKEIERTRSVQDAQRRKELAVIAQAQEVEVAKQIALKEKVDKEKQKDLAEIEKAKELAIAEANKRLAEVDKAKELAIAEANRAIQQANAAAAKFEAEAIRQKGLAEAEVTASKYQALGANKDIYLSEIQRDIAQVMYSNLRDFQLEMPTHYIEGSCQSEGAENRLKTNLDIISAFSALGLMKQAETLAAQPVSGSQKHDN